MLGKGSFKPGFDLIKAQGHVSPDFLLCKHFYHDAFTRLVADRRTPYYVLCTGFRSSFDRQESKLTKFLLLQVLFKNVLSNHQCLPVGRQTTDQVFHVWETRGRRQTRGGGEVYRYHHLQPAVQVGKKDRQRGREASSLGGQGLR